MIPFKIESLENYSNALPREDELIGVITANESGKHKLMLKDSAGSIHELSCDTSELQTALAAKANTADLATVATSGSYSDLSGKPAIPSDLSDLSDASGILSAKADLTALIQPGSVSQYEQIPVGPNRKYKTLAEAYAYMRAKSMSFNKGFQLLLDPGTYEAVNFENAMVDITSTDLANKATIVGTLTFSFCQYSKLRNLNISAASGIFVVRFTNCLYCSAENISVSSTTILTGILILDSVGCWISSSSFTLGGAVNSTGISVCRSKMLRISGCMVSNCHFGIRAYVASECLLTTAIGVTIISNCTYGISAVSTSYISAAPSLVSFTGVTTTFSPLPMTVGNNNSYIEG